MNGITHFMSGFLVARAMGHEGDRFETFYLACAAVLPDIDSFIGLFVPFEHGVVTHSYIGAVPFVLAFAAITYLLVGPLLKKTSVSFKRLLLLGFIGISLHFLLDSFTFHYGSCSRWLHPSVLEAGCVCPGAGCVSVDDFHHLYFWPLWDFPPHINTIFPFPWMTFQVRVWVEVVVTTIMALVVLWTWLVRRDNIWGVFSPGAWWRHAVVEEATHQEDKNSRALVRLSLPLFKEVPASIHVYALLLLFTVVFPVIARPLLQAPLFYPG